LRAAPETFARAAALIDKTRGGEGHRNGCTVLWCDRQSECRGVIKLKMPLPADDPSGGECEWVWAEPRDDGTFVLKNVPTFAYGLSYDDTVKAEWDDGAWVFQEVAHRGGHSTYRIYATSDPKAPAIANLLERLKRLHCDLEIATSTIVAIDVLPEADINEVYAVLEAADDDGIVEFDEGHCGHRASDERSLGDG
jgi:hypothetical protein